MGCDSNTLGRAGSGWVVSGPHQQECSQDTCGDGDGYEQLCSKRGIHLRTDADASCATRVSHVCRHCYFFGRRDCRFAAFCVARISLAAAFSSAFCCFARDCSELASCDARDVASGDEPVTAAAPSPNARSRKKPTAATIGIAASSHRYDDDPCGADRARERDGDDD